MFRRLEINFLLLAAVSLLILALPAQTRAQDTVTGAFEGTVTDSQGKALKGADIQIINESTRLTLNLKSDYRGHFYQGVLSPGEYLVRVSYPGYQTKEVHQELKISFPGEVIPIPVSLDPAPPATATATPPPPVPGIADTEIAASLNRLDGRRSGSFGKTEVVTLPVGSQTTTRSFDELALLLPGVAPPPQTLGSVAGPGVGAGVGSAGQFSANGLRSRGNNFTVDGSDNNDEDIGVRRQGFVALIPQPIDSIQEYQVITLLAPAQFGRNIGAQVNAVSKSGSSQMHGTLYGTFNSSQLNAKNFFDTTFGNATTTLRANNQDVLVQTRQGAQVINQPLTVRNESGGEDSFTFWQSGFVIGGPVIRNKLFYFASLEEEVTNATEEHSFAVPVIEQRGAFGTGVSGIFRDPFTGQPTTAIPTTINGGAIFSLYPFPNNPAGIYGANTFTQTLPASGRGTVLSGKLDYNFKVKGREQSLTGRYNFTDDWRDIPVTGGALFSTLKPRVRTQNLSLFLNSKLSAPGATNGVFNQVRLSYGRTNLRFEEVRDTDHLIPSGGFPNIPFLLNTTDLLNTTAPSAAGIPNASQVVYQRQPLTTEQELGPLGQVIVAGFSPIGVDVNNFPQQRVNNTYQVADNLTLQKGTHSFAFGADLRRSELNSDLPRNSRPLVTFNGAPRLIFENGAFRLPTSNEPNQFISGADLAAMGAASNFYLTLNTAGSDARISLRYYQLNFYAQDDWRIRPRLSLSFGLRYEYNTPVRELNRRIENTFNDPALSLAPGLRQFIAGRTSIYDSDRNNFAPRFGFAYSPKLFDSNHTTVFRGGAGVFYDQILGAVVSQSRNVFPTFVNLNFGGLPGGVGESLLTFFNPGRTIVNNGAGQFVLIATPGTLNQLNPNLPLSALIDLVNASFPSALGATLPTRRMEMPQAVHYGFTFEQQLGPKTVLSAAYVGTQGRHLLRFTTPNLGPATNIVPSSFTVFLQQFPFPEVIGRALPPVRSLAGLGAIYQFETTANSGYNAFQLELRGRWRSSLQYRAAYTLSKAMDDVSDVFDLAGAFELPQNSVTLAGERGASNFDSRHRFTFSGIYSFPQSKDSHSVLARVLNKMQIAATARASSGQPFTVNSIFDVNLDGNLTDRLNTTNGLTVTGEGRQPLRLTVDPATLLAPVGQDGAVGRNTFRAGKLFELDLSVIKTISINSRQSLLVRADIFNITNQSNFGIPVRFLEAPGFGKATSTVTPGRRVQFALKYSF